jgi:hypothetical protein
MRARASILPVLLATVTALTLFVGVGTASAHGDEGELTVTKLEQVGPTSVAIEAGIVYEGDGHLAEDATVTATLIGPGGATVGPVQLTRTGESTSLYAATVEVPGTGDWSVEVTSTEPAAEATQAIAVTEQAVTASSTTPPATDGDTAGGDDTTTTAAEELDAEPVTTTAEAEEDEASSPNLTLVVGASLVLFAIVMVGAVLVARQRTAKDAADEA